MSLYGLAVFAVVYALAVASPGPAVAALVARVIGRGTSGSAAFICGLSPGRFFSMAAVMCCVLPSVCFLYVFFAGRARRHLTRPEAVRWVQRGTGAVMAGAAIAVATR